MTRPQRFTAGDILSLLNTDDSDVETPPGTDDEDDDYTPNPPSSEEDSDDDAGIVNDSADPGPSTSTANGRPRTSNKDRYRWMDKEFQPPNATFTGTPPSYPQRIKSPYEYFTTMITEDMIKLIVDATNLYSTQKTGTCLNITNKHVEMVIGMFFRMGLTKMLGVRCYYETDTRYDLVADVMARNKLLDFLRCLHVVDNETVTEETKRNDKLWKIRPWLDLFREQCLKVEPEECNSVDEMIIPFRGKFSGIKQYIRGKPHPWGFKVWCRTTSTGILCDFELYTGAAEGRDRGVLGVGGGVVSRLASSLPPGENFKIFADNFFTSMALLENLKQRGIHYVGTVRSNRLGETKLPSDKEITKRGRGEMSLRVEQTTNIVVVKWYDTKAVTVASTFLGPEPVNEARRWNKSQRQFVNVPRPYSIKVYNENMGGVDLLDSLCGKALFTFRSKRWYTYIFWHTIKIALANAWLIYKRDSELCGVPKKEILIHRHFQAQVATALILKKNKRGRPCEDASEEFAPKRRSVLAKPPPEDVRLDQTSHWPVIVEKRGRCKQCKINNTDTKCEKCNVLLCFNHKRNCFRAFHH